ncbi:hypothetical protein THRCLA_22299 [Thraustotheca clavata]|uniref:Uncharacterized protein n=1 Tax=Thraustotheca clavata TaxID=74557 RepID=A0A1V9Z6H8_9STRA|nr:hypothetical protein THRCLA_22299 [Thraustotheca clavata]
MKNHRSSKLIVLQEKAQFLFTQLQARDQELVQYESKVEMFLVLEEKMSAKIKELQSKVDYYEEKNRELERLRRCQLMEMSDLQKRFEMLEDSYEVQKTIQNQLQQDLVCIRGQLIEQETISAFKENTIKDIMCEIEVMQREIGTFAERTKCQNDEMKCLMEKIKDLEKADYLHTNELESVKKQLECVNSCNQELERQIQTFENKIASKIEKQSQDTYISEKLIQEKNSLEEKLRQDTSRLEQVVDWVMNRVDTSQAQNSLAIAFTLWKSFKWQGSVEYYKKKLNQLTTILPTLHSKVIQLRPSIAGLKQLVYDLSPNPAFSRAILQACKQAVEERNIAYRFAESLSCSNDKMNHFYHRQDIQKLNVTLQEELSKRDEQLEYSQEIITKLEESLQTVHSKKNVIVARLCEKLGHDKAVLTCLVCFYVGNYPF